MSTTTKKWTYKDYLALDDDNRYEILNGNLLMTPSPSSQHQSWSSLLNYKLKDFVFAKRLGKIFEAPMDVLLSSENVVQPDIIYIANGNKHIIKDKLIEGSPDMLVEIVSPSSHHIDYYEKKELYDVSGVKEYWIVDPANQTIEVFALQDDKFQLLSNAAVSGNISSNIFKGFQLDLGQFIRDLE